MTELTVLQAAGSRVPDHPLSPGIRAGDTLWLTASAPFDPDTGKPVGGDIVRQAERVFDNMEAHLKLAGASLDRVVRLTNFLTTQADIPGLNEVYRRRLAEPFPARATVIVAALVNPAYRLVIDCVAVLGEGPRQGR